VPSTTTSWPTTSRSRRYAENWYSERVLRLPCYQPNDRKRIVDDKPVTRADFGLPEDAFVFCCFNASHKFTRFTFERWMEILRGTENSVLWLLDYSPETNQRLREQAQARGVSGDRLVFAPKLPNPRHLARYPLADLFLDTALWRAHDGVRCALDGRARAHLVRPLLRQPRLRQPADVCRPARPRSPKRRKPSSRAPFIWPRQGRGELQEIKARLASANRDTCTLFDVAKLSRSLEDLYRQMRERLHRRRPAAAPNLANLENYFEIGVAQDHEAREIGALTDYEGFYRAQLARRHYHHPMPADGRLWTGEEMAEAKPVKQARPKAA
jgi:hypothetical protein